MKVLKYIVPLMLVALIHAAVYSQTIILNGNTGEKYKNLPISEFTIAEADTSEFSIAGFDNKNALTVFFYKQDGQKIYTLVKNPLKKFKDICMCNASLITIDSTKYIYTAKHCSENMLFKKINVGQDAVLIRDTSIVPNDSIPIGYTIGKMEAAYDSLFIMGFIQRTIEKVEYYEGKIISYEKIKIRFKISISGLAQTDKTGTIAFMQLDDIYDLHGLSGAPVFNSKGEVVGVCSKHMYKTKKGSTHYSFAIVSLFKN